MEKVARATLQQMGLPEGYVGWTMVTLASEFWRDQVAAVPPSRRLFLLPHCLKHAEGCPADYDEFGLDCKTCGACSIADFRAVAEEMGYKVLVAEGSPIVLKIIVSGYVDAIVGVACLNVLEKAIDKILLAGIPCMAVPLLSSDCRNTSVDEDWVSGHDHSCRTAKPARTDAHLRAPDAGRVARCSTRTSSSGLLPGYAAVGRPGRAQRRRTWPTSDPIAATEAMAYDFLAKGGKHSRPFITLAVYDALTGAQGDRTPREPSTWPAMPDCRASGRPCRSRRSTRRRWFTTTSRTTTRFATATRRCTAGTAAPTAINVGDYLIGMGYRLVSREARTPGRRRGRRHPRLPGRRPHQAVRRAGGGADLARLARQAPEADRRAEDLRPEDLTGVRGAAFSGIRLAGAGGRVRRADQASSPAIWAWPSRF